MGVLSVRYEVAVDEGGHHPGHPHRDRGPAAHGLRDRADESLYEPVPINASMGMLFSLAVAFVLTPWASYLALRHVKPHHAETMSLEQTRWFALFNANLGPFLNAD
jgi:hypothetical protein